MTYKRITRVLLLVCMVCAVLPGYAQSQSARAIQKVFRAIVKNDFNQAWNLRQKVTDPNAETQVLLDLSDALILARPAETGLSVTIERDPWHAMTLVRNIYVRGEGIEQANEFLSADGIELSVDMIEKLIEKRLIDETFKHDSEMEYRRLLSVIDTDNPAYARARNRLAEIDFAARCTSAQGCRNYMRDYPESPMVEKAKALTLKFDYEDAESEGTAAAWKRFINSYSNRPEAKAQVEQAQRNLIAVEQGQLVSPQVTLQALDDYASTNKRLLENPVFTVYDNLINLPMHSHRLMSLKLNFGGATSRVDEEVKQVKGKTYKNYYNFNAQGLLTESYDGYLDQKTTYRYDFDATHGFYPVSRTTNGKTYTYSCSYDVRTKRLDAIKCTDGTRVEFSFDENGRIVERRQTDASGKVVTATYKSGKIRTETGPKQTMKFLKYDDNRATEIDIVKGNKTDKWTYVYELNDARAWVKAVASLNGKQQFTITRQFSLSR